MSQSVNQTIKNIENMPKIHACVTIRKEHLFLKEFLQSLIHQNYPKEKIHLSIIYEDQLTKKLVQPILSNLSYR